MNRSEKIAQIIKRIQLLGKENLDEMLHSALEGIQLASGAQYLRIYLEDLTVGALCCSLASSSYDQKILNISYPIVDSGNSVSYIFANRKTMVFRNLSSSEGAIDKILASEYSLFSTYLFPLVHQGKSIGVVAVDSTKDEDFTKTFQQDQLSEIISILAEPLDKARIYHQQLLLSRSVDELKKREAAKRMVESAVRLIDRLSLASVLIPVKAQSGSFRMEILASHASDSNLKSEYEHQGDITLSPGESLISRYVDRQAVITDETLLNPVFVDDLSRETLQKKALTEKMELRSLYVVPRYDPLSRKVICLVNYFTREPYRFNEFERGILQTHAEMVEKAITEIGAEHLEIKVLAEISELLKEADEDMKSFLGKILSKAVELIGADTGSIALAEEKDGEKWLVVEDSDGNVTGAKSKGWLKKYIPPFRIGGYELPKEERSLTGYAAWSKMPKIISDVKDEAGGEGFHRSMHDEIRSEIAVPFICDDEAIAVICLNSLSAGYFTEEHKRILHLIGLLTARHIADIKRIDILQNEVSRLTSDVAYKDPQVSSYRLGNIIGNSRKSQEIVEFINIVTPPIFNRIALWSKNVLQEATIGLPSILVTGPTGAGKEFFFNNIYNTLNNLYRGKISNARELPVKKTNIAAYSGELTYSELFGHKKGAFTGAYSDRKGILEECQGGIVFLDEIGDADMKTQVQLLRFLDNGGFIRLGENVERYSRVLLIAATNKNLQEEIQQGRFREDLFHRLSELSVEIPSLNERKEDIPDLAVHFLGKLFRTYRDDTLKEPQPYLDEEAKKLLVNHHYYGNIRELRSILLRALFFRKGLKIGKAEISAALKSVKPDMESSGLNQLNSAAASEILKRLESGGNFWEELFEPFSNSSISRDVVIQVIERCAAKAGRSMPQIAIYIKAVGEGFMDDPQEKRKFFKFKNFLYKTVKLKEI